MADRGLLPYNENRFFSPPGLCAAQRPDHGTFPYMFSCPACIQDAGKKLGKKYTCEEILGTLKGINFADVKDQGFMPLYKRETITDGLHAASGFRTDYQFITKRQMKTIQKKSKGRE